MNSNSSNNNNNGNSKRNDCLKDMDMKSNGSPAHEQEHDEALHLIDDEVRSPDVLCATLTPASLSTPPLGALTVPSRTTLNSSHQHQSTAPSVPFPIPIWPNDIDDDP